MDCTLVICRTEHDDLRDPPLDIVPLLIRARFYRVSRVGWFEYDSTLVLALVERWRPKKHTIHTTQGKTTITLEDVARMLCLPCMGQVVTRRS